ncbi:Membrane protease subunit, stomatin/prohibitin family, contains C-terminal Zn-ribbon domain [Clostridium sp. DSM 8431]|uniref:SPFH domain-containing protein n=1 Tax=Clostridium sp. DSM 8431 TaxID=1761781 RepID=UPI0008F07BBE|nr:SPFH domain-containing protein [Clostridium sp. DSM 8431]SFU58266.1 Membrane protease subunit, stomatin/prohibitin family, contains C-terminal Zn-ribbon domain [Clostridium sp. DSM 8431]
MGLFKKQFANIVEWEEYRDDILFWKWNNKEIKKGSKLIIRPGQDAIFMFNGKREGIFKDEGSYDIESEIIPFLSTLKGFKFGFNSGLRVEVLFINTKEVTVKWGTRQAINIPHPSLPGGMPIRALGTFNCKISDYITFIDKIAGVKNQYTIDDVKERIISMLDQLLMKWIVKEGKDMFNLQANSFDISKGICEDLDMEMSKIGVEITNFNIGNFSYPEEVQKMVNKVASQSMVGDVNKYQQIGIVDAMTNGKMGGGSNLASDMMAAQMGMQMGKQMMDNMNNANNNSEAQNSQVKGPKFCPNCGTKTTGGKFCSECGTKLY